MSSGQTDAAESQLMEPSISQTDQQCCSHPREETVYQSDPDDSDKGAHTVTELSVPALSDMALSVLEFSTPKGPDECQRQQWLTDTSSSEGTTRETEVTELADEWSDIYQNEELLSVKLNRAQSQALLYEGQILIAENLAVREKLEKFELRATIGELEETVATTNLELVLAGIQILTAKSEAEYYEAAYLRSIDRISQMTDELTLLLNHNAIQQKEISELRRFKIPNVWEKWNSDD